MEQPVILRAAAPRDADAVSTVWLRSRRASVPAIPAPVHTDEEVRHWMTAVLLPTADIWVAEAGQRVVGLMALHDGWVEQLYIDPDWTGRGIGTRLLAHAQSLSPNGVELWTFAANSGARRFYERHGFTMMETTDGTENEEGAAAVRYVWGR